LAEAERGWFRLRFAGLDTPKRYQTEPTPTPTQQAVADPAVAEQA